MSPAARGPRTIGQGSDATGRGHGQVVGAMQHATVDHGRRMRAGIARPSAIDSDASHRLVAMLALALAASALAAWYGFLASAGSHPALQPGRAMVIAGAVGNAAVAAVWVVTRTYGSLLGPDATKPAKVGFGDLVSTLLQVTIVAACVVLLRSDRYQRPAPSYRSETASVMLALGITV